MANLGSLGSLFIDVAANTAAFETDVGRAARLSARRSSEIQKGFQDAAKNIALTLAGLDIGRRLGEAFKDAIDTADKLNKSVQKIGIDTEGLSGLRYAAGLADVEFEALEKGLVKFNRTIVEARKGSGEAAEAFRALGISQKEIKNSTPEQLFQKVADGFSKYRDGAAKSAVAVALLGKSGADLIPLLNGGSAGIRDATAELRAFGGIVTPKAAEAAEAFNDNLSKLKTASGGVFTQLAEKLLPSLVDVTQAFVDAAKQKDTQDAMVEFAGNAAIAFAVFGESIVGVVKALAAFGGSVEVVINDLQAVATFPGLLASKQEKADYARFLEERAATLKKAGERYTDLINYNGTAVSDAIRTSLAKQKAAALGMGDFDPVAALNLGGTGPQIFQPGKAPGSNAVQIPLRPNPPPAPEKPELKIRSEEELRRAAAAAAAAEREAQRTREQDLRAGLEAEEASRRAVDAARKQLAGLQAIAGGQRDVSQAAELRYEIEQGNYRGLDEFTKARLKGLANEIELAEFAASEEKRRQDMARDLAEQYGPKKTGRDFRTQLGEAKSVGAIDSVVGDAAAQENTRFAAEQAAFIDSREQILAAGGDYDALMQQAAQAHQDELTRIEQAGVASRVGLLQNQLAVASDIFGGIADVAAASGKKGFALYKAFAIAQAITSTISGAIGAYSRASEAYPPPFGQAAGIAAAAVVTATGLAQVARIRSTQFSGRRYGGAVSAAGAYEVAEPGNPELLRYGNKTLLMMGDKSGTVTPAKAATAMTGRMAASASALQVVINNTQSENVNARAQLGQGLNGEQVLKVFIDAVDDPGSRVNRGLSRRNGARTVGTL